MNCQVKVKVLLACACLAVFLSCHHDPPDPVPTPPTPPQASLEDSTLTFSEDSLIANAPDTIFKISDLFFDDGQSFEDYAKLNDSSLITNWGHRNSSNHRVFGTNPYKDFLENIASKATFYTTSSNFDKKQEGDHQPKQYGLNYVSSGDNFECRVDKRFNNGTCPDKYYGLECNGFICRLFMDLKIFPHRFTTTECSTPDLYNNYFATTSNYKDLKYELKGKIPISDIKKGDIIYFKRKNKVFHLGMALKNPTSQTVWIYNANGVPSIECDRNTNADNRGVRCADLTKFIDQKKKGTEEKPFANYYVLKLIEPDLKEEITIIDGNNQTGKLDKPLAKDLKVRVTKGASDPVTTNVYFTPENPSDVVSSNAVVTDNGYAQVSWTVKGSIGQHKLTAAIKDANGAILAKAEFLANAKSNLAVTTTTPTSITQTSGVSGGNIIDDGGSSITAKGVCWSTLENPVIDNNLQKTNDGAGKEPFSSTITGLTPGVDYHVRAYATNSTGTEYGNDIPFKTLSVKLPTLTTNNPSSITSTSAISGGNITDDGGSPVTARGICWSINPDPTIINNNIIPDNRVGVGMFTSLIDGLTSGQAYHARAFATNIAGTAYGNDVPFTTDIGEYYWSGSMTMNSHQMTGDCCDFQNQDGIPDCGTGGCQSASRALFSSLSGTSTSISFIETSSTNNVIIGALNVYIPVNDGYSATIGATGSFTISINSYAPDRWGGGNVICNGQDMSDNRNAYLNPITFIVTSETPTSKSGTWSGKDVQVSLMHCKEDCSGTWSVSKVPGKLPTADRYPVNP